MTMLNKNSGAIWIAASQIGLLASNFLLLKLLTTQLSVGIFGYYSLCMSIILFARQILYDPFSIVIAKECASTASSDQHVSDGFRVVRYVTDRISLLLLLLGSLSWVFASALDKSYINGIVAWSCFMYLCANGAQGIYFNVLNSISARKSASAFSMVDSILKFAAIFLAFWLFEKELVYALLPISFGAFAVFLGLRFFIIKNFTFAESDPQDIHVLVKRNLLMSMPLYLPILFAALKSVGDRWILAAFISVEDLAAYSVLLQLGYLPMLLIIGMAQTYVAPNIYKLCALKNREGSSELRRYLNSLLFKLFIFTCAACSIALGLADWVFQLLVGRDYHIFSNYLPIFVVSGAIAAVSGVLHLALIGVFDTRMVGMLMITSVVIGVTGATLMTVIWGFVGAVAGLVIASSASAFIYWFALYCGAFRFA